MEITIRERLRIFVAGPYAPVKGTSIHDCARAAQSNVDTAIEVGGRLMDLGHFVYIPHLNHYVHIHYSTQEDRGLFYNLQDMSFLKNWANAFYFIMPSPGANIELREAKALGLKIYQGWEVPLYVKKDKEKIPSGKMAVEDCEIDF